jgi:hypothetical protein
MALAGPISDDMISFAPPKMDLSALSLTGLPAFGKNKIISPVSSG